jgi:hypothetical protein
MSIVARTLACAGRAAARLVLYLSCIEGVARGGAGISWLEELIAAGE